MDRLIWLTWVVIVAGCHQPATVAPSGGSEPPGESPPDPRCEEASGIAGEGMAHAEAGRSDRAVEALSRALISCESQDFQRDRRADLVRVLDRWSAASEAEGNIDRALFLREAILTLAPVPEHRIAYLDALIATRRLAAARRELDASSRAAPESMGPALAERAQELSRLEKRLASPRGDAGLGAEATARLREAGLELLLGSPAKAASLLQSVTPESEEPCSRQLLAEALWQSGQQKEARVAWSRELGMHGRSFEETGAVRLRFSAGREEAPELSDEGARYLLAAGSGTTRWEVAPGLRCSSESAERGSLYFFEDEGGDVEVVSESSDGAITRLKGCPEGVKVGAIDPTNSYVATGSEDGAVKLWELSSGKLIRSLGRHRGKVIHGGCGVCGTRDTHSHEEFPVEAVRFGGGGAYVASCASSGLPDAAVAEVPVGQVKVWAVPSGRLIKSISLETPILDIALDEGGRYLAGSTGEYTVEVWALPSGKRLHSLETNVGCGCPGSGYFHSRGGHHATTIAIDPSGRALVAALTDGRVMVWDLASGRLVKTLAGHSSRIRSLQIGAENDYLAWGTSRGRVKVWDLSSGRLAGDLQVATFADDIDGLAIDPGGRGYIATAAVSLKLWGMPSGKLLETVSTGHYYGGAVSVVMDPEGRFFGSGGGEGKVRLWELPSAKLLEELPISGFGSHRTDAASASYWASGTQSGGVDLWSIPEAKRVGLLGSESTRHTHWVTSVAIDPLGRHVVSGSRDKTAILWAVPSGEVLHTLVGHQDEVTAVALDPSASYVVSGGKDKTVKVWSVSTGELLHDLTGHEGTLRALAVAPAGRYLASGADDGVVKLWAMPSGELLATLHVSDAGEWLVLTPDGYVDGSHLALGFVERDDDGGDSIAFGHLRRSVPDLLPRLLGGDHDYRLTSFHGLLRSLRGGAEGE